ncbi:MAG: MFS transporter [Promethearchaeota archaeon]
MNNNKELKILNSPPISYKNSKLSMASYGFGKFSSEFFTMAFTTYCFFFYETELGLNSWLVGIGYAIYAIWNSINDPLIGFLTNKPLKFMKNHGRRFPWILISSLPWSFTYILIFAPPISSAVDSTSSWLLFLWLVICSCLFDFLYSAWDVNYQALFPDKFRDANERRKAAGIATLIGVFGIALGAILPPLLIEDGVISSYKNQAIIVAFIGFFGILMMLPGVKEPKEMIERQKRIEELEKQQNEKEDAKKRSKLAKFWELLKYTLKQSNLMSFLVLYCLYQSFTQSMTASIPYYVKFILERPQDDVTTIMAVFLVGALVSIPIWTIIADRINNNRKMIMIGAILLAIAASPFIFLTDYTIILVVIFFYGVGLGLFWTMTGPVFADAIDEVVVNRKKREEGVFMGFRAFFGRLAYLIQGLSFSIIHKLTGFIETADNQTNLAKFGIHMHISLVPIILILIGLLYFSKKNDLTPQKIKEIKKKLDELKI